MYFLILVFSNLSTCQNKKGKGFWMKMKGVNAFLILNNTESHVSDLHVKKI